MATIGDISKYAEIVSLPVGCVVISYCIESMKISLIFGLLYMQGLHSASAKGILAIDLQGGNPARIVTGKYLTTL